MAVSTRRIERAVKKHLKQAAMRLGSNCRGLNFSVDVATSVTAFETSIKRRQDAPYDIFIDRRRHADEGSGYISEHVPEGIDTEGVLSRAAMEFLDANASTRARVIRRAAAVKRSRSTDANWAFDIHPLALGLLRHAGFAEGQITASGRLENGNSLTLDIEDVTRTRGDVDMQVDLARCSAGWIDIDIHEVHDEASGTSLSLYDSLGSCHLILHDVRIPETILASLPGKALCDVVRHEIIGSLPSLRIRGAESHVTGTRLSLDPDHVPLAPAPSGVDVGWRDLPASRR